MGEGKWINLEFCLYYFFFTRIYSTFSIMCKCKFKLFWTLHVVGHSFLFIEISANLNMFIHKSQNKQRIQTKGPKQNFKISLNQNQPIYKELSKQMKERINLLLPSVMVYTRISWWNWGKKTIFFSPMLSIKQYLQKIYPKPFFFFFKNNNALDKNNTCDLFHPHKRIKTSHHLVQ